MKRRVCIIGAGASGLMAAIFAARHGAAVTILESNPQVGKKLLATGNGKCNLTNLNPISADTYRGSDISFVRDTLQKWSVSDTIHFFENLGIMLLDHDGWVYPYAEKSSVVLTALLNECSRLGIKIKTNENAISIEKNKDGNIFTVLTQGWHYEADAVILAAGSPASEVKGSSDSGMKLAEKLGHTIIPLCPALTSLNSKDKAVSNWGGCRAYGEVTLFVEEKEIMKRKGQLQLINGGISGIPIFQLSRFVSRALLKKEKVRIALDFLPGRSWAELKEWFVSHMEKSLSVTDILGGLFPENLCHVIKNNLSLKHKILLQNDQTSRFIEKKISNDELNVIISIIKSFNLNVDSTASIKHAQVCAGGVSTKEIDSQSCASKLVPGLYITGEMLDIDGDCGGWNLQFAWATGAIAGKDAAQ